jgi:magnesium chelatase family protein
VLASATTFALAGVDAVEVTVEADIHPGLPAFTIVGLPDTAVQESRERVRAALVNSGFEFPLRRITVNLAPADLRKAGPWFDLALAAAVLGASGQVSTEQLSRYSICGELGLEGSIRPIRGALVAADSARRAGRDGLIVPAANVAEAGLVEGLDVVGVDRVRDLERFLAGNWRPEVSRVNLDDVLNSSRSQGADFAEVRGHSGVKRALEVAAAGGHNVLLFGPPGSGKSMLARRLPTILPPLTFDEALEVTRVHSVAGLLNGEPLVVQRPFRAPHHSISSAGLIGGGSPPAPGETSLAQHGVLFLDELTEFRQAALEALRQPIEEGAITLTRGQRTATFPTRFMLLAATNPCPCGRRGDARQKCSCSMSSLQRYTARMSGPLLDRIDIFLQVSSPSRTELTDERLTQTSAEMRARVVGARRRQTARFAGMRARCNADVSMTQLMRVSPLGRDVSAKLYESHERVHLSARGHNRAIRVARTIADIQGRDDIEVSDIAEAVAYRAQ